jgi:cytochrome c-type biogenesis protein CcmH
MSSDSISRRRFLSVFGLAVLPVRQAVQQQTPSGAQRGSLPRAERGDSLAGRGAAGTLRDPSVAGRPRVPTNPGENDAEIQRIEQQLACTCGCTLDVFTCRTTDFTCTYSPQLHQEVLALRDEGKTAQQILDSFVARYGEKALMAPKPQGFNLWGYLLPGVLVTGAAVALVAVLRRRETIAAAQPGETQPVPPVSASPEELERLNRALEEVPD